MVERLKIDLKQWEKAKIEFLWWTNRLGYKSSIYSAVQITTLK
jgi:hypothetical protein